MLMQTNLRPAKCINVDIGGDLGKLAMNEGFNLIRAYHFTAQGKPFQVEITHRQGIWQLFLDGVPMKRLVQECSVVNILKYHEYRVSFPVELPDNIEEVQATATMTWEPFAWRYELHVNGTQVPACWTPRHGDLDIEPPEVTEQGMVPVRSWRHTIVPTRTHTLDTITISEARTLVRGKTNAENCERIFAYLDVAGDGRVAEDTFKAAASSMEVEEDLTHPRDKEPTPTPTTVEATAKAMPGKGPASSDARLRKCCSMQ